jgi:hypothetical protein
VLVVFLLAVLYSQPDHMHAHPRRGDRLPLVLQVLLVALLVHNHLHRTHVCAYAHAGGVMWAGGGVQVLKYGGLALRAPRLVHLVTRFPQEVAVGPRGLGIDLS